MNNSMAARLRTLTLALSLSIGVNATRAEGVGEDAFEIGSQLQLVVEIPSPYPFVLPDKPNK